MKTWLIVALLFLTVFNGTAFSGSHLQTIIVGPYTQNVSNESITILWETNVATLNNSVLYWNDSLEYIAYGEENTKHHEVRISPPFSHGYYKVISDGVESKAHEFKLASYCYSKKYFKCIIYGDSRGVWDNWKNATRVANAINREKPDIVIHGGDMVSNGRIEKQWEVWLDFMKPLMQNTTLFAVLGNHERNGSRYYEIFSLPGNERYYSFDYGICHFIILNTNEAWDESSAQYKWLENDLANCKKTFKIVCFHEPIYCSGGHSSRKDIREAWEPLFMKYNVSIVFQSHNHYYQRTKPINGIIYVVTGGGGAPLYEAEDSWFIEKSKKAFHYCLLNVSLEKRKIRIETKYVNGTTFDEFVLQIYPKVEILKPSNGIYVLNRKIADFSFPLIIGKIDVEAYAEDDEGISKVEFYVDNKLKEEDETAPYEWQWNEFAIGWHEIMVRAYDNEGNTATDKIDVMIFNL